MSGKGHFVFKGQTAQFKRILKFYIPNDELLFAGIQVLVRKINTTPIFVINSFYVHIKL